MMEIRPSTAADIAALYEAPPSETLRSWTLVMEGEPVAIGGLSLSPGRNPMAFSRLTNRARAYPVALIRAARFLARRYAETRQRVFAVADPTERGAPRLLARLGFRPDAVVDEYRLFVFDPAGSPLGSNGRRNV